MKKLSLPLLADTVITRRKGAKMTQAELAKRTGMNRSMLSKLETQEYTPSIAQLQALTEVLCFEPTDLRCTPPRIKPIQDRRRRNRLRRSVPRRTPLPAQRCHRSGHHQGEGREAQQL